jgi:hypothetical protein
MRKRRLRLALSAVALFGVVAWLVWPTSSPVITAAKEKYARLQLGMSEAEVAATLGGPPERNVPCYGEWVEDRKLYRLTDSRNVPNPEPGKRLYDLHAWTFADRDSWGQPYHTLAVQGVIYRGRLVWLLYTERQDNAAKKWLRRLAAQLSLRLTFLDAKVKNENQAVPPP